MTALSPGRLCELVGAIYDCTIDPDRWPQAMRDICGEIRCVFAGILLVDLESSRHRFFKTWNMAPAFADAHHLYYHEMTLLYQSAPRIGSIGIDEPLVLSREVPHETYLNTRYYREWAAPQGICDSLQTMILRQPRRIGVFGANRHDAVGLATDDDIETLRLIAPHIRRAVTISDVLELEKVEACELAAALDALAAAVVIIGGEASILHANAAAERMFTAGGPLQSRNGRVSAGDSGAARELIEAVALAQRQEAAIGARGIGVSLGHPNGTSAIAHVLPLAYGEVRTRLMPGAAAAIFVTPAADDPGIDIGAVARAYGLTAAEARLLARMTPATTVTDLARGLGLSEATARTHLTRIFAKTGVSRQPDLFALLASLSSPVRRSKSGDGRRA
jgi:DNA-binding CsgD family transcriptional regulator/PAS domain-containing protein